MNTLNTIGMVEAQTAELVEKLNVLLANYSIFTKAPEAYIGTSKGKPLKNQ